MRCAPESTELTTPCTSDDWLADGLPRMLPRSPRDVEPHAANNRSAAQTKLALRMRVLLRREWRARMTPERRARWFVPAVAGILYFSEGFPYGLVTELFPAYLRF